MDGYKRILVAVDLSDESERVVARAQELARLYGAELSLLHVIEFVPVEPMGEALLPSVQLEDELVESARTRLAQIASRFSLDNIPRTIRVGNIKAEVVRQARDERSELIVLGSRERHGLAILLNFTEDTVLHAAPCDVLAVRLGKGKEK